MSQENKARKFWNETQKHHDLVEKIDRNLEYYYPIPKNDFRWDRPMEKIRLRHRS